MNEYLPPERGLDETTEEYLDRLEWHRRQVPDDILHAPVKGYTATPRGLKHWSESEYIGRAGSGVKGHTENAKVFHETVVEVPSWTPAPIRRRTPQERLEDILGRLTQLALQSYADGQVLRLPRSICEKLVLLGVYRTVAEVESSTVEEVTRAFDVYARGLLAAAPSTSLTPEVGRLSSVTTATSQEGATQVA